MAGQAKLANRTELVGLMGLVGLAPKTVPRIKHLSVSFLSDAMECLGLEGDTVVRFVDDHEKSQMRFTTGVPTRSPDPTATATAALSRSYSGMPTVRMSRSEPWVIVVGTVVPFVALCTAADACLCTEGRSAGGGAV